MSGSKKSENNKKYKNNKKSKKTKNNHHAKGLFSLPFLPFLSRLSGISALMILLLSLFVPLQSQATGTGCVGRFVNPITDVSWVSIFPITIGAVPTVPSPIALPDTVNPPLPIAICPAPPPVFYRIGITLGYWEPHSLADVTRIPYCMVNMGFQMSLGMNQQQIGGRSNYMKGSSDSSFYHVHWYKYPVTYLLNLITSMGCMQAEGVDLAYMSELDPLWDDDMLAFILNPESILFGNPIAQLACIPEAIATSANVSLAFDVLFWCAGSQGGIYPLTGSVAYTNSTISNAVLVTERMNYKLHRQGMIMETKGVYPIVCQQYPEPILPKSRYRYQFTNVVPEPYWSHPYATTTVISEAGKDHIVAGTNFGILNFRKRNCVYL
ncbi:conjugal transfer pilus assembly protein TraU [Cysteiniphilum marinum]|uniref:conjugal transfer pilus assembly protein TraU n=1 Tax=Cysteiniphilum marinum TaxID=2774191 RepID=UPI001F2DF3FD|nr:conjugal transfer pilus assembly protein TraU [Cysteiniphilum marinum]